MSDNNDLIPEEDFDDIEDQVILTDDEGNSVELTIMDAIETDDGSFVAFFVPEDDLEDNEDSPEVQYFIMQAFEKDDGEEFVELDDPELIAKLSEIFEARYYGEDGDVE